MKFFQLPIFLFVLLTSCYYSVNGQVVTHEDSLAAGLNIRGDKATAISGYGEAFYTKDFNQQTASAQLRRVVLFVGHRFNQRISFFSEMEMENAAAGANKGGEIAMEQAFLKFDINRTTYVQAGLFVPRIGITNENHLPNTYNGNERTVLETMLIPTTWRELGVGLYGSVGNTGLNYSIAAVTGLNADGFSMPEGIGGGRSEGFAVSARQLAATGALLYYTGHFRFQASSYAGGSVGFDNKTSDRLGLSTGAFGTPVYLNEINGQYRSNGITLKAIACIVNIPDADKINTAFANNTPKQMQGAYAEAAYDVLYQKFKGGKQLHVFSRYENINMMGKLPSNGIENPYYKQQHLFVGLSFLPIRAVVIKVDYHYVVNGEYNQALIINPVPYAPPFYTQRKFLNIGLAYSF